MGNRAIERCAYCRRYVPVTWVSVESSSGEGLTASVAICEACRLDGR